MKVIDNRNKSVKVNFKEIKNGEVFESYSGNFYIKTTEENGYNAVDITDGSLVVFDNLSPVTPINATLTINRLG